MEFIYQWSGFAHRCHCSSCFRELEILKPVQSESMAKENQGSTGGIDVILFIVLAVLVGNACRILQRKIHFLRRLPYTVGIFGIGLLWGGIKSAGALSDSAGQIATIKAELFLFALLPSLVFYSAFNMKWYV